MGPVGVAPPHGAVGPVGVVPPHGAVGLVGVVPLTGTGLEGPSRSLVCVCMHSCFITAVSTGNCSPSIPCGSERVYQSRSPPLPSNKAGLSSSLAHQDSLPA